MNRPVLVDTAVLAYALGGEHKDRAACQRLVAAAGAGEIELHASVELVQELLFHRMRKTTRKIAAAQARDTAQLCVLHDFDAAVLTRAIDLVAASRSIGGRDAVHAATALHHGLSHVVSPDLAFDGIDGLHRLDPADVFGG